LADGVQPDWQGRRVRGKSVAHHESRLRSRQVFVPPELQIVGGYTRLDDERHLSRMCIASYALTMTTQENHVSSTCVLSQVQNWIAVPYSEEVALALPIGAGKNTLAERSEEHTSELQSP